MNDQDLADRLAARLEGEFAQHPRTHVHVPAGWETIVAALADHLDEVWPDWQLKQVKQKLGYLEVYLAEPPDEIAGELDSLVAAARRAATHRCERCGTTTGAPYTAAVGGWRMTLCEACRDEAIRAWLREVGLTVFDLATAGGPRPDRLAELNEIVTVLEVALVPEELTAWLRRPHSQFQGATALEAIAAGRASDVHAAAAALVERSDW